MANVRFLGAVVQQKNASGVWVRIPYSWSRRYGALVYNRWLALQLAKPPVVAPRDPAPSGSPKQADSAVAVRLTRSDSSTMATSFGSNCAAVGAVKLELVAPPVFSTPTPFGALFMSTMHRRSGRGECFSIVERGAMAQFGGWGDCEKGPKCGRDRR